MVCPTEYLTNEASPAQEKLAQASDESANPPRQNEDHKVNVDGGEDDNAAK
jgi:hypothetical protein